MEQIQCFKMPFRVVAKCVDSLYGHPCLCQKQYLDGVERKKIFLNEILFGVAPLGREGYLFVVFLQPHISISMGHSLMFRWFYLTDCQAAINPQTVSQDGKG